MPLLLNPERIANEEVEITTNDSGQLVLTDVVNNETLTIDRSNAISELAAQADVDDLDATVSTIESDVGSLESQTSGLSSDGTEADLEALHTDWTHNTDNPASGRATHDNSSGEWTVSGRGGELSRDADFTTVIQAALDTFPSYSGPETPGGGTLKIPEGDPTVSSTISLGDKQKLYGEGIDSASLYLADGTDANMVEYVSSGNDLYFGELNGISLFGNKENNTAGHGIYSEAANGKANDMHLQRVFVDNFAEDGFHFEDCWGYHVQNWLSERCVGKGVYYGTGSQFYLSEGFTAYHDDDGLHLNGTRQGRVSQVESRGNGGHGFRDSASRNVVFSSCFATGNSIHGYFINQENAYYVGCHAENNGQDSGGAGGFSIQESGVTIVGGQSNDLQDTPTQNYGYHVNGANATLIGVKASGNVDAGVTITSNGVDTNIVGVMPSDIGTVDDGGTRTRWDGVIGGGPLGGVDLSTTTGQFDGDLAVADGTSTAAAGAWARWDDANTQWQYADPTGTV